MPVGNQVHLVKGDAVFDELKIVPVDVTGVRNTLPHSQTGFHVSNAFRADASHGIALIGADPLVVSPREPFKQPVQIVPNDG